MLFYVLESIILFNFYFLIIFAVISCKEQYLPYYIRSNMKLKCHTTDGSDARQFDSFIDEALRIEERKEILEV